MSICHLALVKIPEDFATPSSQPVQSCLDGRRGRATGKRRMFQVVAKVLVLQSMEKSQYQTTETFMNL